MPGMAVTLSVLRVSPDLPPSPRPPADLLDSHAASTPRHEVCLRGAKGQPEGQGGPGSPKAGDPEGASAPLPPVLAQPRPLRAHGPCLRSCFQATDEDAPPNNQITYSIVSASVFGSYFDVSVYEGYGGSVPGRRARPREEGGGPEQGCMLTPLGGGIQGAAPQPISWGERHRPGIALL